MCKIVEKLSCFPPDYMQSQKAVTGNLETRQLLQVNLVRRCTNVIQMFYVCWDSSIEYVTVSDRPTYLAGYELTSNGGTS